MRILLRVLVILGLNAAVLGTTGTSADAQVNPVVDPIVGSWYVTGSGGYAAIARFTRDHTFSITGGTEAEGLWRSNGGRRYTIIYSVVATGGVERTELHLVPATEQASCPGCYQIDQAFNDLTLVSHIDMLNGSLDLVAARQADSLLLFRPIPGTMGW
jgi:hypothetical protein